MDKYTVVTEDCATKISATVSQMMELGWKPQGGVSVAVTTGTGTYLSNRYTFAQAMVMETP